MAKKLPARPNKGWTPDAPLKLDWDKALQRNGPANPPTQRLERSDNPLFSQAGNPKHPLSAANHKQFNRQKKG